MEVYLSFLKTYIFGEWYNYISLAVLLFLLVNNVVFFICFVIAPLKRRKKKRLVKNTEIEKDYGLSIKRAVERIKTAEAVPQVFSGYVDVGYIKTLINDLKDRDLTESDKQAVDEFEVYLLNFVNRQPNSSERQELSARLNCLIKTLSKYA